MFKMIGGLACFVWTVIGATVIYYMVASPLMKMINDVLYAVH